MKRKEEAMKKYIASFLAICMIFVMVPSRVFCGKL